MVNEKMLKEMLNTVPTDKNIVFVGIGTDKAIFDSLGCLTCSMLEAKGYTCYGTIEKPIHALNVEESMDNIMKKHSNDIIIGIDAAIGKIVGNIAFRNKSIKPGLGVNKKLREVGSYSIIGVTTNTEKRDFNNVRLYSVIKMCEEIVETIEEFVKIRGGKNAFKKN